MNNKLLTENILREITSPIYNNGKNFKLNGFNIPFNRSNIFSNIQEEKRLQWLTHIQMEMITDTFIEEENLQTKTKHDGFLIEEILLDKIKKINKNIIKNFIKKYNNYTFDTIANKILKDFISKAKEIFNSTEYNKNIQLHNLFFNDDKQLKFKIDNDLIEYNVIDKDDPSNNEITIIKERKLIINKKSEHPDFAVFYNGLPFIVIEMKSTVVNGENGMKEAANDYYKKKSYHNFLSCIGTNGKDTFISSSPKLLDPYIWQNYKDLNGYVNYYDENDSNGLFDIINELLSSKRNLLFYFENCTMISECGNYLKNARIQQYFTAKQVYEKMLKSDNGFKTHFQHHTRTGKSFTFKIIAKMAYKKLNEKYKKCIFFTHDVSSVMPSVMKEFNNLEFPTGKITEIKDKKDYKKTLSSNNIFGMYITNMQKIAKENQVYDDSNNVLIFIDEVHTHQNSANGSLKQNTMADFRKLHFPNATVISATASPLVKEVRNKKGEATYRNITEELHGKCINKVTPSDALKLNLVTRLMYTKVNFKSNKLLTYKKQFEEQDKEEAKIIKEKVMDEIGNNLIEKALQEYQLKKILPQSIVDNYNEIEIDEKNYEKVIDLNPFDKEKEQEDYELMHDLLQYLQNVIAEAIGVLKSNIKSKFRQNFWEGTIKEKIKSFVIPDVLRERQESNGIFTPKFFYVVDKRNSRHELTNGEKMLNAVKELIQEYIDENPNYNPLEFNVENNVYHGVRFGFDNSEEDSNSNFNGDLEGKSDITKLFEVDKLEKNNQGLLKNRNVKNPVDVLILVRKKLMGYDNKNLVTVYLDKDIDEENIKEMLQLATRGTTKREGKKIGNLKDLTYSGRNTATYQKAFSIYDQKDGVKDFLFDQEEIIKIITKIEENKKEFIELFVEEKIKGVNQNNIFDKIGELTDHVKLKYWLWKDKKDKSDNPFIGKYIALISKLDTNFKSLISPSFILEKEDKHDLLKEILKIFIINSELLSDIKNKNANIFKKRYTSEEIIEVLEKTFSTFGGVKSFIDKINIKYKDLDEVLIPETYKKENRQTKITSAIGKLKNDVLKINNSFTSRISEELDHLSLSIDTKSIEIEEQERKLKELQDKVKSMEEQEEKEIKEKYNGSRELYAIHQTLKDLFAEDSQDLLSIYAENLNKRILEQRNLITEGSYIEIIKELLDKVAINRLPTDIDLTDNRWRVIYNEIFIADEGIFDVNKKELEDKIKQGFTFDDIDNENSNIVFRILKEYV